MVSRLRDACHIGAGANIIVCPNAKPPCIRWFPVLVPMLFAHFYSFVRANNLTPNLGLTNCANGAAHHLRIAVTFLCLSSSSFCGRSARPLRSAPVRPRIAATAEREVQGAARRRLLGCSRGFCCKAIAAS